ncbi:MAG: PmoA family protein [Chloroflexi bacterium]|nr:PmoA family protein [Chloroflexota bacterium]
MIELAVHAGELERVAPLVTARVPAAALAGVSGALGAGPIGEQAEGGACLLRDAAGSGASVVAQYDPFREELTFVVPGALPAGSTQRFVLEEGAGHVEAARAAPHPVRVIQKLDRLVFRVGDEAFATYNVHGGRRPYFWPVLGPAGASVIRGQGTSDHPHHTGMGLNYGGHSEGGSANIWSDWDEPPYGPGGRMLHRGFRRLAAGPVFGEVVQDLTYVNAYGDPIVDEVRTIRCWWTSPSARYLDFRFDVISARDRGPQPFLFMMRLPDFFDIPSSGRVTNSAGHPVPPADPKDRYYRAVWIDASGPTGDPPPPPPAAPPETLVDLPGARRPKKGPGQGPWNGIAVFDHPGNDGYPGVVGKYAGGRGTVQITQAHYPPAGAPNGPFSFRQRVYIHDGDAESAAVPTHCADYTHPCRVDIVVI